MKKSSITLFCLIFVLLTLRNSVPAKAQSVCYIHQGKILTATVNPDNSIGPAHCLYNLYKGNLAPNSCRLLGWDKLNGSVLLYYNPLESEEVCSIQKAQLTVVVPWCFDPTLSPNGNEIAFQQQLLIRVLNQKTRQSRTVADIGTEPFWARRSRSIAYVDDSRNDDREAVNVIDSVTGKCLFTRPLDRPAYPFLSPSGSYLAVAQRGSRLFEGDTLIAVIGSKKSPITKQNFTPTGFLPASVEDWSLDEKWILWDWRVPDPSNDGSWIADDIGLTSLNGKYRCNLGRGESAKISSDGKQVFFLRPVGDTRTDLMVTMRPSWKPHLIARNVLDFFVY